MADENPANTKNGVASKTLFGDGGEHGYEYTEDE
jgi:hypothetical protein